MRCSRRSFGQSFVAVLVVFCMSFLPAISEVKRTDSSEDTRLLKGEVVVRDENVGQTRFVAARILIDAPPSKVWPVLSNPFEFQRRISPRMKTVEVLTDREDMSVLQVSVDIGFLLPAISYAVESRYQAQERISFKRVSGTLKDFRGYWEILPKNDGAKTEVVYSMYVDPGIPVPQWLVRAGVREELPRTLMAMRERVMDVHSGRKALIVPSIMAAGASGHAVAAHNSNHS